MCRIVIRNLLYAGVSKQAAHTGNTNNVFYKYVWVISQMNMLHKSSNVLKAVRSELRINRIHTSTV